MQHVILGSHNGVHEGSSLLGCYAVSNVTYSRNFPGDRGASLYKKAASLGLLDHENASITFPPKRGQ